MHVMSRHKIWDNNYYKIATYSSHYANYRDRTERIRMEIYGIKNRKIFKEKA